MDISQRINQIRKVRRSRSRQNRQFQNSQNHKREKKAGRLIHHRPGLQLDLARPEANSECSCGLKIRGS